MKIIKQSTVGGASMQVLEDDNGEHFVAIQTSSVLGFGGSHVMSYREALHVWDLLDNILNGTDYE